MTCHVTNKNTEIRRHIRSLLKQVTKSEMIKDLFIIGLLSNNIWQLFENKTLDLQSAFDQSQLLKVAQQNLNTYTKPLTT